MDPGSFWPESYGHVLDVLDVVDVERRSGRIRPVDTRKNFKVRVGNQSQERAAAYEQHYSGLSGPKDPRAEAQEAESAEAVRRDEMAEKLRAAGCPANQAHRYVEAVLSVLREKDRAMAEAMSASEETVSMFARPDALEAVRVMAVKLVQAPKPRFSAGCLLLAAGIDYPGIKSERDWAAQQNLSPTLASDEVRAWQANMRLPKTGAQKSEAACKVYADTNGARKKTNL